MLLMRNINKEIVFVRRFTTISKNSFEDILEFQKLLKYCWWRVHIKEKDIHFFCLSRATITFFFWLFWKNIFEKTSTNY